MRTRLGSMSPAGGAGIPPTVEFPSLRRERVDWHKLASVDLHDLASGCSIEFLQENLSHVTFCDAEAEFDVSTASGQRSLLKMYRLAQLIIQYLFLSQEYMESQVQQSQEEVQHITEKYEQVKAKLLQQVEEAKKMKASNKNMRETVKYVNSIALVNGMFQPSKCPLCCKTFRGQDFLQSHLWRKHPSQAGSIVLPQIPSGSHSGTFAPNGDNRHLEVPTSIPDASAPTQDLTKTNDVDSFRLLEIEKKFDRMNENFYKIMKDMENQKQALEKENENRQEEIKKAWEEKKDLERGYEAHINKLSEHISHLQNTKTARDQTSSSDYERLLEYVSKQDMEIAALKSQIENQPKNQGKGLENDFVDGISGELQNLKMQLHEQKKNHKRSLAQIQDSLRKEYEDALENEKLKLSEMVKDISHREKAAQSVLRKPPPSPKTLIQKPQKPPIPDKSSKSPVKSPDMYEDSVHTFSYSHESGSDSIYARAQQLQSESESESDTDTSKWNQSNLKIQHLQISSKINEEKLPESENVSEEDEESEILSHEPVESEDGEEEAEAETTISEESSSESLSLNTLLRENPQLWNQMRNATSEVLGSKLSSLGLHSSVNGIKSDILTSCLSALRKDRRKYEEKYENFVELRKKLTNEVTTNLDDKIENVENSAGILSNEGTTKSNNKRKQSGVLSRVVHNVRSKVKEKSKAITTSVSKTGESVKSGVKDIFNSDSKASDVKIISRPGRIASKKGRIASKKGRKSAIQDDDSSSELESEHSSNAQVEVHNETSKSVSRNLFGGGEPMRGASGIKPQKGNFFENKTYGEVEDENLSDWDSEPEYENVRKAEPPTRKESLNIASEPADYPNATTILDWDPEPKPIKLKKPSGEKVSTLTRSIELQLGGRKKQKLAGAVDIMSGLPGSSQGNGVFLEPPGSLQSTPTGSQQHIQSVSESSNTIPTSLWGSADAINKTLGKGPRPSTSKGVTQSWDSEDDLEISEIE